MFDFIKKLFQRPPKKQTHRKRCTSHCKNVNARQNTENMMKKEAQVIVAPPIQDPKTMISAKDEITVSNECEQIREMVVEDVSEPVMQVDDKEKEPEESVDIPKPQYVIKLVKKDVYKFELLSAEGKTVIKSGEYTLKRSCVSGIQSVKKNGATENIDDRTVEAPEKVPNPKYEISVDENSKYRFALKAPNGYVILTSSAYTSKKACMKAVDTVRTNSQTEKINDTTK